MNKILIIGASGLLGSSLVKYFSSNDFKVGALSRSYSENENGLVKTYAVNILNYENLELIISDYDIIINCTGQITNPISDCIILNTEGIKNIINAVKVHDKYLIHLSTVSVYGTSEFATEDSIVNPESVYGTIKYFAEYQVSKSLTNYTILRVSNLYGEGQTKGILGYITRSFYNNEKNLFFNNDGSLKRYYLHIDDLSAIIEQVLLHRIFGRYNILGKDFFTITQLISLCEKIFKYSFNVEYDLKSPVENVDKIEDSKFKKKVDYKFKHSLAAYLKEKK